MSKSTQVFGETKTVPLKSIHRPEDANVRQDMPRIEALAKRIAEEGLLQPPVVTNGGPDDMPYTAVAGNRRLAALELLGWTEVPVVVKAFKKGDAVGRLVTNIIENTEREDVNPLDLAERAHQLVTGTYPVLDGEKSEAVDRAVLAERLGWDKSHLNNLIRVFEKLDADVLKLCKKHNPPLRKMVSWAGIKAESEVKLPKKLQEAPAAEQKAYIADKHATEVAEAQMAEFQAWLEAKKVLDADGRTRAKRGEGKGGKVRGGGGEDNGDVTSMVNKTKTDLLQVHIAILTAKAKEEEDPTKAAALKGEAQALRWVTGDLERLPGVTQKDIEAYEASQQPEETEEGDGEE